MLNRQSIAVGTAWAAVLLCIGPLWVFATPGSEGDLPAPAGICNYFGACSEDMYIYSRWGDYPTSYTEEYTVGVYDGDGATLSICPARHYVWFLMDIEGRIYDSSAPKDVEVYHKGLIVAYNALECTMVDSFSIIESGRFNRGLAVDDRGIMGFDYLWYTKENADSLYKIDFLGEIVSAYPAFEGITGLAFDSENLHLWGIMAGDPDMLVQFDVADSAVLIQGPVPVPWSSPGAYSAGGLDYVEEHNLLVAVNRNTGTRELFHDRDPAYAGPPSPDTPGVSLYNACGIAGTPTPWGIGQVRNLELLFIASNSSSSPMPMDSYVYTGPITGLDDYTHQVPNADSRILWANPNPFSGSTQIGYALGTTALIKLEIYDVVGRKVATLVNGRQGAGEGVAAWNAGAYAPGIYFCRLQAGDSQDMSKVILLK